MTPLSFKAPFGAPLFLLQLLQTQANLLLVHALPRVSHTNNTHAHTSCKTMSPGSNPSSMKNADCPATKPPPDNFHLYNLACA